MFPKMVIINISGYGFQLLSIIWINWVFEKLGCLEIKPFKENHYGENIKILF